MGRITTADLDRAEAEWAEYRRTHRVFTFAVETLAFVLTSAAAVGILRTVGIL